MIELRESINRLEYVQLDDRRYLFQGQPLPSGQLAECYCSLRPVACVGVGDQEILGVITNLMVTRSDVVIRGELFPYCMPPRSGFPRSAFMVEVSAFRVPVNTPDALSCA
jgi:hypothetical protein